MQLHKIAAILAFCAGQYAVAEETNMDRLMQLKTANWERAKSEGFFGGSRLYKKLQARRPCVNGVSGRQGEAQ